MKRFTPALLSVFGGGVLALSLSYLPLERIACSVLTVTASGRIIGRIQRRKS